ncbi:MAG TPA: PTS sugar transporter subunit IIC, partial [Treponema sp.]|nr:PTS sugar transporter subunit IIC [Treponema sp.]
ILTSAVTGPISTCLFKLQMNGAPVSSGMGTCGFVGQIGMITGWFSPSDAALAQGATAITPGALEWLGLLLVSFVLPALLSWAFGILFRKIGWIKDGDLTLEN